MEIFFILSLERMLTERHTRLRAKEKGDFPFTHGLASQLPR